MKLFCRLTTPIITPDGDFIPKGAHVQVLSWVPTTGNTKTVMCLTSVHMFVDSIPDPITPDWNGNINNGLYIDVNVNDLEFVYSTL